MEENKLDILSAQKKFIHDLATPISIVQGMIEIILPQLKAKDVDPKIIDRLEKALVATVKIDSLLKANREYLSEKSIGVL